jgi:hypothetical protein
MLRGDFDALAGVGGHEVFHLGQASAGEIGHGFLALPAMHVAVIEADDVKRPHRA